VTDRAGRRDTDDGAIAIGSKEPKPAAVEAEDELPEISESTVDAFSQDVSRSSIVLEDEANSSRTATTMLAS